ncbi:SCO family protein [Alisedimentitalea sp. MJ-SS2]|uniref:SCO family protein n=1 Tax=Aliisedimentitalea sp. MJ-SS2 TaxID=3049795 RepID=UPI00291019B0|nr:SCO family protein [Alisedimentitalea sp. MJ-SS2]MDU8927944.1 SCO family protein [Alisedimentitalea sp. MJ-SS2]
MTKYYAWAAVVAVVLAIGAIVVLTMGGWGPDDKYAQCRATKTAGGVGSLGGPFTLVDFDGEAVTSEQVIDQPSLLYFGYTFCPDVCPLDNSRNAEAVGLLDQRGLTVKPVFISIDPERDTPEVMRDFAETFDSIIDDVDGVEGNLVTPRFVGLTGSMEQVKAASKAYRTYFKKQEPEEGDEEYYLVDHSTWSYLVFPGEGLVGLFKRGESPQQVADRIGCFVENR